MRGINGSRYEWNSTNKDLIPTHSIKIGYNRYCPYCGEKMFPIQGHLAQGIKNYNTTGYCCICQGARDELEYKNKQEELAQKHRQEVQDLEKSYREKLKFCTKKLIDMQLQEIVEDCESSYEYSYFSNINNVKEMMGL